MLIARRADGKANAGYWEFPGGKLEAGETARDCLEREFQEEFGIAVHTGAFITRSHHVEASRVIELVVHHVRWLKGRLKPVDHDAIVWCPARELLTYRLAPADVPVAALLKSRRWTDR
ncbi:MAG: (deoxy)nucleoside triphosphate pyrophosphohydrolase [Pseudomonadales bacterium]|nr:(deoxy)nucleoside triphosphate pyrophosphohydrolase [Pseudomonadales bacterium]MCP5183730.1 (deoxy)nucleoside triphosphate pyrophosphohydrolase [Pseudomonadales bacterium]